MAKQIVIGRASGCDVVVIDPRNRVSRKHAVLIVDGKQVLIRDAGSTNGTFLNGQKIERDRAVILTRGVKVTLSKDYSLDWEKMVALDHDPDETRVLDSSNGAGLVAYDTNGTAVYNDGKRTICLDPEKTTLAELCDLGSAKYTTIGRASSNTVPIHDPTVSKYHCRLRLITKQIIEVEDLVSTNGTYADGKRLEAGKPYTFATSVALRLGQTRSIDLRSIFPDAEIIQKNPVPPTGSRPSGPNAANTPITKAEQDAFNDLEGLWREYNERQSKASNVASGFGIGGAVLGMAALAMTGGAGMLGLLCMGGGTVLGRWLGQQASNEIRSDLTYEDAFLEAYACPRCKESFQKKSWITIRDCYRCKLKFR
jgi:pSer/pThr/pTyr-binding forkhead associated (FHA) protein